MGRARIKRPVLGQRRGEVHYPQGGYGRSSVCGQLNKEIKRKDHEAHINIQTVSRLFNQQKLSSPQLLRGEGGERYRTAREKNKVEKYQEAETKNE